MTAFMQNIQKRQTHGERKWNNLISNENSPLNTLHTTIYLKNVGALSKLQLNKLFTYIEQTKLNKKKSPDIFVSIE